MAEGREAAERLATFGAMDERDRRKLQRLVDAGEGARDEFIKANLRLVVSVARRYQGNGLAMADLVQDVVSLVCMSTFLVSMAMWIGAM